MDSARVAEYLGANPIFACLDDDARSVVAGRMRLKRYARDEVIFHRDDPAAHLYVIVAGTVKVSLQDEHGREIVVSIERGGDAFGELALFDESPRSATVTALAETEALLLARSDFMSVLQGNPQAMGRMLGLLARMVRRSTGHVEDLVFLDLPGRVAKCLLDLSELSPDGAKVELTQDDLASFVGATRVSVNRVLADLEKRGAIDVSRRHIAVLDRPALERESRR